MFSIRENNQGIRAKVNTLYIQQKTVIQIRIAQDSVASVMADPVRIPITWSRFEEQAMAVLAIIPTRLGYVAKVASE